MQLALATSNLLGTTDEELRNLRVTLIAYIVFETTMFMVNQPHKRNGKTVYMK